MATVAAQIVLKTGIQPTFAACSSGGDAFANDGKTLLIIKNANASSRTLTIISQNTVDGLAVADRAITLVATDDTYITDLDKGVYNDSDGLAQLTYSTEVDLTIGVIRLNGV